MNSERRREMKIKCVCAYVCAHLLSLTLYPFPLEGT
jgi:hypothetical protein